MRMVCRLGRSPKLMLSPIQCRGVFFDEWESPPERLKGSTGILRTLVAIAEKGAAKAA